MSADYVRLQRQAQDGDAAATERLYLEATRRGDLAVQLSAVLGATLGAVQWQRLVRVLDAWDDADVETATRAVSEALDGQHGNPGSAARLGERSEERADDADALRTCPRAWIVDILEGKAQPRAAAARRLVLEKRALSDAECQTLAKADALQGLTSIKLHYNGTLGEPGMLALFARPGSASLRDLEVGNNTLMDLGARVLAEQCAHLDRLDRLALPGNMIFGSGVGALASAEHFRSVSRLVLDGNMVGSIELEAAGTSPLFEGLRSLSLAKGQLDDRAFGTLLQHAPLDDLTALSVARNRLSDGSIERLADPDQAPPLHQLDVSWNRLTQAAAATLARSENVGNLSHLDLTYNPIGDDGVSALAGSSTLTALESLVLSYTRCTSAGARALAGCPNLGGLKRLELGGLEIGDDGLQAILEAPTLGKLERLGLWDNGITVTGAKALAEAADRLSLRELRMFKNHLGEDGFGALLAAPALAQLETVEFHHLSHQDGLALAASGAWPHLQRLTLRQCKLGDAMVTQLAHAPWLQNLTSLTLQACEIGASGLEALLDSEWLTRLNMLFVTDNPMTARAATLITEHPNTDRLETLWVRADDVGGKDAAALLRERAQKHLRLCRVQIW